MSRIVLPVPAGRMANIFPLAGLHNSPETLEARGIHVLQNTFSIPTAIVIQAALACVSDRGDRGSARRAASAIGQIPTGGLRDSVGRGEYGGDRSRGRQWAPRP